MAINNEHVCGQHTLLDPGLASKQLYTCDDKNEQTIFHTPIFTLSVFDKGDLQSLEAHSSMLQQSWAQI